MSAVFKLGKCKGQLLVSEKHELSALKTNTYSIMPVHKLKSILA